MGQANEAEPTADNGVGKGNWDKEKPAEGQDKGDRGKPIKAEIAPAFQVLEATLTPQCSPER